jgi:hypothetical protein
MEMQGLKPSVLMGKLKQISLQEFHLTMIFFFSMYLVHLPPSRREAVGAGTHEMAAAMVKA